MSYNNMWQLTGLKPWTNHWEIWRSWEGVRSLVPRLGRGVGRPTLNGLHITSGGSEGRASPRAGRECCWPSIPRPLTAWCRFARHLWISLRHPTPWPSLQPGLVLTGEITWIKCPCCEQVRAEGRAPRLPSLLLAYVNLKLVRKSTN